MEISREKRQFQIVVHTQKYLVWISPVKNALLSISLLISSDISFSLLEVKSKGEIHQYMYFHSSQWSSSLQRHPHIHEPSIFATLCYIGVFRYLTFAASRLLNLSPCHRRSLKTENLRPCCKNSLRKRCVGRNSPPEQSGCPSMVVSHSAWFFCVENKRKFERWGGVWIWPLVILWNYTDCLVFNVRQWNRFL